VTVWPAVAVQVVEVDGSSEVNKQETGILKVSSEMLMLVRETFPLLKILNLYHRLSLREIVPLRSLSS
jgi:hypothetical protein